MVADDLGDQRQAEARAVRLGGDERIEQVRHQVLAARPGRCRATQNSSGSDDARRLPGTESRTPGRKAVVSTISPPRPSSQDRLGSVLHEIEEDLDQLVAVGEHRRQRRIVLLDDPDVARKAGLRRAASRARARHGC